MATSSQASSQTTLLDYGVATSPSPLQVSGANASITITVSNSGIFPVTCTGIIFSFNLGSQASDLAVNDIKCSSNDPAWQISEQGAGSGQFLASPLSANAGIVFANGYAFEFSDIQINGEVGTTWIGIAETASSVASPLQTNNGSLPVSKFLGDFSFGNFVATPQIIAMGATTVLSWTTSNNTTGSTGATLSLSWANQPPIDVTNYQTWTTGPLSEDTVIYLTASTTVNGEQLKSVLTFPVTILNALFTSIVSDPLPSPAFINFGDTVTLTYVTNNVDYVLLFPSRGTGALLANGSVSFIPDQSDTSFTLIGYKRSNLANMTNNGGPLPYKFNPAVVNSFTANPAAIYPGGSVILNWDLTSALPVSIDQGVGNVSGSSVVAEVTQTTSFSLTYQTGSGNVKSQPLTVDIISLEAYLVGKTYASVNFSIEFNSTTGASIVNTGVADVLTLSTPDSNFAFSGTGNIGNYSFQFYPATNTLMAVSLISGVSIFNDQFFQGLTLQP